MTTAGEPLTAKAAKVGVGSHDPDSLDVEIQADSQEDESGSRNLIEFDFDEARQAPRRYYHFDFPDGRRVYLRSFNALEAEQLQGFEGVYYTAALMALSICDKSGNLKYSIDDPEHPQRGWAHLVNMDCQEYGTIVSIIKQNTNALRVDVALEK